MDGRVGVFALTIAVGAGFASLALVLTGSGASGGLLHADDPAIALLIGWSFAGAGVVASVLRPLNRFGVLLYGTGLAWFSSALMASDSPVLFTIGLLTAPWWLGLFVHSLHAFPGGRLDEMWSRLLVLLMYVDVTVVHAVRLLFTSSADLPGCAQCPGNVLEVSDQPDVAASLLLVQQAGVGSLVMGGTLLVLAHRWRVATALQRRVLAPVLATGAVCVAVQAVSLAAEPASVRQSVGWVGGVAFAAVPVSFLLGLLRQRLDRAAVGQLVVDLGTVHREGEPFDGMLRAALRDPSLEVAYWRPETQAYVDSSGRPFPIPGPDDGRAVTGVERDGRRIAALVHDPSVADDPQLISGAVAAAGLALENERLHAEVRAQLEELRASRRRLVDTGDRERRRLERNLHDGAQQRLLSVSMLLSQLERTADTDSAARELAATANAELAQSLAELRELAAGLHPAVLTDHGLEVALEGVAARTPIPVQLDVDLPHRPPPPVEVAAYFVITEAVTNAVKHAGAHGVTVHVCTHMDEGAPTMEVQVVDDGVGGVDATPGASGGSGLQGLSDRLAVLGGRLEVISPPGQGTSVRAVIPCGS